MFYDSSLFRIHWYSWGTVAAYVCLMSFFLYGILRPRRRSEWRSAGMAWAWVVALYAEMYGLPLTLYVLSHLLGPHFAPADDFQLGHVWAPLLQLDSYHWTLIQTIAAQFFIASGALLSVAGWKQLWRHRDSLATAGLYAYIRHPQYTGFFLFIFGSLLNWPTIPTLSMAPFLIFTYYRLAVKEEQLAFESFGDEYAIYRERTGMFFPPFRNS